MPVDTQANPGWTPARVAQLEPPVLELEEDYEARLGPAAAEHRIVLGLGGIPIEIGTNSADMAAYLSDELGAFCESSEPLVHVTVNQTEGDFPFRTLVGTMMQYERGSRVVVKVRQMAGYVDAATRTGRGLILGSNYRQDLGNFLRVILSAVTPPFGAVLFHTAAIARDGHAYVFFGPSTAGKSTLSALASRRHEIMTDDMLVLRLVGSELRAATCGFWGGETKRYPSKRIDLPVKGFFRLRKAVENRIEVLEPRLASVELLCGIPGLRRTRRDRDFVLHFAAKAVAAVPFHELHFHKRDDSFWETIDGLE